MCGGSYEVWTLGKSGAISGLFGFLFAFFLFQQLLLPERLDLGSARGKFSHSLTGERFLVLQGLAGELTLFPAIRLDLLLFCAFLLFLTLVERRSSATRHSLFLER